MKSVHGFVASLIKSISAAIHERKLTCYRIDPLADREKFGTEALISILKGTAVYETFRKIEQIYWMPE